MIRASREGAHDRPVPFSAALTSPERQGVCRARVVTGFSAGLALAGDPSLRWGDDKRVAARVRHGPIALEGPPLLDGVSDEMSSSATADVLNTLISPGSGRDAGQAPASGRASGLVQGGEQLSTGLLAPAAGLGADRAVLVHLSVAGAFFSTGLAGSTTSLQDGADKGDIPVGGPGEHPAGGRTDVSTVEVEADAGGQLRDHVLTQAGIRAGGAGLGALEAGGDAFGQFVLVDLA